MLRRAWLAKRVLHQLLNVGTVKGAPLRGTRVHHICAWSRTMQCCRTMQWTVHGLELTQACRQAQHAIVRMHAMTLVTCFGGCDRSFAAWPVACA